jgi:hypothetical protein
MDDQRTHPEDGGSALSRRRVPRFSIRVLMLIVVLFAVVFTTVNMKLKRRNLDVSARRTTVEGLLASAERFRKSYDDYHMDKQHEAYVGVEKQIAQLKQQLKKLDE